MPETRQATLDLLEAVMAQQTEPYAAALLSMPNTLELLKSLIWTQTLVAACGQALYGSMPTDSDFHAVGLNAAAVHERLSGLTAAEFESCIRKIDLEVPTGGSASPAQVLAPFFLLASLLPLPREAMSRRAHLELVWTSLERTWPPSAHYQAIDASFRRIAPERLGELARRRSRLEISLSEPA